MYFYIHVISYYIGNNRPINIDLAINKLRTTQLHTDQKSMDKNLFIVQALYDELTPEIETEFVKLIIQTESQPYYSQRSPTLRRPC